MIDDGGEDNVIPDDDEEDEEAIDVEETDEVENFGTLLSTPS